MIASHELFVGALVSWAHVPRGGYGYMVRVPAKVAALSLDGTRATIEVARRDGAIVKRRVSARALVWERSGKDGGK